MRVFFRPAALLFLCSHCVQFGPVPFIACDMYSNFCRPDALLEPCPAVRAPRVNSPVLGFCRLAELKVHTRYAYEYLARVPVQRRMKRSDAATSRAATDLIPLMSAVTAFGATASVGAFGRLSPFWGALISRRSSTRTRLADLCVARVESDSC